jgi:hypothetical protein
MRVTVVSSLDVFSRQKACAALAADSPDALVVFHDLLDYGLVIRRTFKEGRRLEREESLLEHGCLSCTVRLDVVPTVTKLLKAGSRLILGLPPAVAGSMAVQALLQGLGGAFTIDSVVLACAPDAVEDQIWDHHSRSSPGSLPFRRTSGRRGNSSWGSCRSATPFCWPIRHWCPLILQRVPAESS